MLAFLDRSSLVGTEDLATRQDPGNQGMVRSALCFRYVAARKVWLENHPRVGARKAWLWNLRHAEAQMGWLLNLLHAVVRMAKQFHHRGSAQTEMPLAGS